MYHVSIYSTQRCEIRGMVCVLVPVREEERTKAEAEAGEGERGKEV